MAVGYNPRIVTDGLVLALDAGNTKSYVGSGTTWRDLSGRGNTGTLTNGPTFSSANGGSIVFDGTDDKVLVNAGTNFAYGTGDFTVEAFIYATTLAQTGTYDGHTIFSQTTNGVNYLLFNFNSTGTIGWTNTTSGGGTPLSSNSGVIKATRWHHVVTSRVSNILSIYVDGIVVAQSGNTFDFNNTTYNPAIGNYTHTDSEIPFAGRISTVRVYKGKGLTAAEVQRNFNALRGRFGI